jgi:hypothetical protein
MAAMTYSNSGDTIPNSAHREAGIKYRVPGIAADHCYPLLPDPSDPRVDDIHLKSGDYTRWDFNPLRKY